MTTNYYLGTAPLIQLDINNVGPRGTLRITRPDGVQSNDLVGIVVEFPGVTANGYSTSSNNAAFTATEGTATAIGSPTGERSVIRLVILRMSSGQSIQIDKVGGGFDTPTKDFGWSVYILNQGPTLAIVTLSDSPTTTSSMSGTSP